MRAVVQRVSKASVSVDSKVVSSIGTGLLLLLGVEDGDEQGDADWLAAKIASLRVFPDNEQRMNLSLLDAGGEVIVVSQFTLHASYKKGNRPSFIRSAHPEKAEPLYEYFCQKLEDQLQRRVGKGVFGAMMDVALVNDGPVTIIMDTKNKE